MKFSLKAIAFLAFIIPIFAQAQSYTYQDGKTAYDHGDYQTAYKIFSDLAQTGDSQAQNKLGIMYLEGNGVGQDYTKALKLFHQGADQNFSKSQNNIGLMYYNGAGVAQDYGEAVRWYRMAADQGYDVAESNLGNTYYYGQGVARDYAQALYWYQKSSEQNYAPAEINLGIMYRDGQGVAADYAKALQLFTAAAQQGIYRGQMNIGKMYEAGQGLPQNYAKAFELYKGGVDRGDPAAMILLGNLYYDGHGVAQDKAQALQLYLRGAQEDFSASERLGDMYYHGEGTVQDYAQAIKWYREAAKKGMPHSQAMMGYMYTTGEGVTKDDKQAAKWYEQAAAAGDAASEDYLGVMYGDGKGVTQDWQKSYAWIKRAADQGNEQAKQDLPMAAAHLSHAEQQTAQMENTTLPVQPTTGHRSGACCKSNRQGFKSALFARLIPLGLIYTPINLIMIFLSWRKLQILRALQYNGTVARGTITADDSYTTGRNSVSMKEGIKAAQAMAESGASRQDLVKFATAGVRKGLAIRYKFQAGSGMTEKGKLKIMAWRVTNIGKYAVNSSVEILYSDRNPSQNYIKDLLPAGTNQTSTSLSRVLGSLLFIALIDVADIMAYLNVF